MASLPYRPNQGYMKSWNACGKYKWWATERFLGLVTTLTLLDKMTLLGYNSLSMGIAFTERNFYCVFFYIVGNVYSQPMDRHVNQSCKAWIVTNDVTSMWSVYNGQAATMLGWSTHHRLFIVCFLSDLTACWGNYACMPWHSQTCLMTCTEHRWAAYKGIWLALIF